jgi:GAF domain-containing protein
MTENTDSSPDDHRPAVMDLQRALTELGRLRLGQLELDQVLTRVARLAQATVAGADEVSVTLIEGDHACSVAFTGDLAVQLDERQYARGFGPCMDAARGGETIVVADTSAEERYPGFAEAAARAGVCSSLSVGMPAPQRTVGALNLYSRRPGAFDAAAVQTATAYADFAAVALRNASLLDSSTALARQLEGAMASRAVIEQAKGVLMGRLNCSPQEASEHLARQSKKTHRTLRDVAAQILADARTHHGQEDPEPPRR